MSFVLDLSPLRRPRSGGLRVRWGGDEAAEGSPSSRELNAVQLLPPQRRGCPARMVVSPVRLPDVVPGRPRHAHQRGAERRSPGELTDDAPPAAVRRADRPHRRVTFTFDGKTVHAHEGDTIGSALYAAGQRTFSRSFKYHRRRGLMCCSGNCPNCLVSGRRRPGRARVHRAGPRRQQGRAHQRSPEPRGRRDVDHRAVGGRSRRPASTTRRSSARASCGPPTRGSCAMPPGSGSSPNSKPSGRGGPSTVAVTPTCSWSAAVPPALPRPGRGRARRRRGARRRRPRARRAAVVGGRPRAGPRADRPRARRRRRDPHRRAALGHFDGLVPVWQGDTLHQIRARHHIYATGAIEQPLVFAGNDLPGVMLSGGARRLAGLYGVAPGRRAVVVTVSDRGIRAALALQRAGVEVALVADLRTEPSRAPRGSPRTASRRHTAGRSSPRAARRP